MRKFCAIIIGLAMATSGLAVDFQTVNRDQFERLWRIAPERMPPTMPPLAVETGPLIRKHCKIWVDHEFLVDADGKPSAYKFHGIEPKDVDPRPFMAMMMFNRYRPMDGVAATPVHYRDRDIFHMGKARCEPT